MCSSLENPGEKEGVEYDVVIDACFAEFRAEASGAHQLSQ
jgi:hypothetical protein